MNSDGNGPRLLGVAFLFVFVASALSDSLLTSIAGTGSTSDILVNISNNLTLIRISNLIALINCLGIVVLAVLLYIVFNKQYKILAPVALGWWLTEAVTLAVSKIGAYALIPLGLDFVAAGTPENSYYQALGNLLYYGIDRQAYLLHMLFFCLGGIIWYYLFYRSGHIPRVLSIWGVAAICLVTINTLLALYDRDFPRLLILIVPYAPYELVLGVWLIIKGFNASVTTSDAYEE